VSKALDQLLDLLKMSDYEADEYQNRLEERADRRFDPKSRRKIQSMGQRESKPSVHNLPGLNRKTMRDKDRDLKLRRERAIMGLDLPSIHGFGGDDREIHPGEETNYTEEAWKKLQTMRGKGRTPNVGRSKRPVLIESPEDLSRLFGGQSVGVRPGDYFYDDSFGSDDDDDDDESESVSFSFGSDNDRNLFAAHLADIPQMGLDDRSFLGDYEPSLSDIGEGIFENRKRPWTTSGPINYVPETEEWVNNPFKNIPTNWGIPFNEETGFTKGNSKELKGCPINVGEAFSEAWDVLKALPEQQMFTTLPQKKNLREDDDYWYGGEEEGHDAGDRQRALGTVHPAIYGLLQRENAKRNFPDTHHRMRDVSSSNQEMLPNLNLQTAGAQKRFIRANPEFSNYEHDIDPSIDGHPQWWNQMAQDLRAAKGSKTWNEAPLTQKMVTSFRKMGFPPSNGPPSPSPSPPSKPPNGGGQEEYSHKDLDAESLIDFLIQTLHMDYQDAKVLVTHHKTKELAGASRRKAKAAAEETVDEVSPSPPSPQMGGPPMGGPI